MHLSAQQTSHLGSMLRCLCVPQWLSWHLPFIRTSSKICCARVGYHARNAVIWCNSLDCFRLGMHTMCQVSQGCPLKFNISRGAFMSLLLHTGVPHTELKMTVPSSRCKMLCSLAQGSLWKTTLFTHTGCLPWDGTVPIASSQGDFLHCFIITSQLIEPSYPVGTACLCKLAWEGVATCHPQGPPPRSLVGVTVVSPLLSGSAVGPAQHL